jgi:hypothetical protein
MHARPSRSDIRPWPLNPPLAQRHPVEPLASSSSDSEESEVERGAARDASPRASARRCRTDGVLCSRRDFLST